MDSSTRLARSRLTRSVSSLDDDVVDASSPPFDELIGEVSGESLEAESIVEFVSSTRFDTHDLRRVLYVTAVGSTPSALIASS